MPTQNPTMMNVITRPCMWCGQRSEIEVNYAHYQKWVQGALIQNAFPELNADERELVKLGTHPECWGSMAPEEEENHES